MDVNIYKRYILLYILCIRFMQAFYGWNVIISTVKYYFKLDLFSLNYIVRKKITTRLIYVI